MPLHSSSSCPTAGQALLHEVVLSAKIQLYRASPALRYAHLAWARWSAVAETKTLLGAGCKRNRQFNRGGPMSHPASLGRLMHSAFPELYAADHAGEDAHDARSLDESTNVPDSTQAHAGGVEHSTNPADKDPRLAGISSKAGCSSNSNSTAGTASCIPCRDGQKPLHGLPSTHPADCGTPSRSLTALLRTPQDCVSISLKRHSGRSAQSKTC